MKTNILIFSGGSGSNLLIEYLKKIPDLDITIVVNAYDNGMSTGILRKKINNFLGPSDIRKNVEILCDNENLKKLLKIRTTSRKIENLLYSIMDDKKEIITKELKNIILSLSINKYLSFKKLFCHKSIIQTLVKKLPKKDHISLGNFLFTTLFLIKKDFNESVEIFNNFFLNKNQRVININNGENLYLKAKTKSNKLLNEEEIVDARFKNEEIIDIYLNDRNEIENMHWDKKRRIKRVWRKGQDAINEFKQYVCYKNANKIFSIFKHSPLAKAFVDEPFEYVPSIRNKMTLKDVDLTYEDVIIKFMQKGLLPKNFLSLKPNENQKSMSKNVSKKQRVQQAQKEVSA